MAIKVNSLPDYVEAHKDELFVKAVAGTKTLDYIEIMPNVKFKDALNYLDSTVVLADGSECGWNPQGDDTFSQRYIEVKPISIQKEFCWKDFRQKYMNYELNFAAGRETLPFEEKIAASNVAAIKKEVEKMIWQGNATVGVTGLVDLAGAEESAVKVTLDATDMVANVDAMVAAIPAGALEKGVYLFLSWTAFRNYVKTLNAGCCANRGIIDANVETLAYAGDSRITLVPVAGLETGNAEIIMVAAPSDALVYGTDIEGSEGIYEIFYDKKESKFLFNVLFNAGVAIKFPDEVTLGVYVESNGD